MLVLKRQNERVRSMKTRLRQARLDAGYNASEVGRLLGITRSSVSAWENLKRPALPSKENLKALANLYKTSVDSLVGYTSSNILPTAEMPGVVPLFKFEDFQGLEINVQPQTEPEKYVFCPVDHSNNTYTLTVQGMSMVSENLLEKSYIEGTMIYCDPALKDTVKTGQNVIAMLDTGIRVFKQYVSEDGRQWLRPLNSEYPPIHENFIVESVVIGSFRPE